MGLRAREPHVLAAEELRPVARLDVRPAADFHEPPEQRACRGVRYRDPARD